MGDMAEMYDYAYWPGDEDADPIGEITFSPTQAAKLFRKHVRLITKVQAAATKLREIEGYIEFNTKHNKEKFYAALESLLDEVEV